MPAQPPFDMSTTVTVTGAEEDQLPTSSSNSSGMPQVQLKGPGRMHASTSSGPSLQSSLAAAAPATTMDSWGASASPAPSAGGDTAPHRHHAASSLNNPVAPTPLSRCHHADPLHGLHDSPGSTVPQSPTATNGEQVSSEALGRRQQVAQDQATHTSSADHQHRTVPGHSASPKPTSQSAAERSPQSHSHNRSQATSTPRPEYARPALSLSEHLGPLYQKLRARYYQMQRMELPSSKYNNGYDDREGHYVHLVGEDILDRYRVLEKVGKGCFGTVLRCYDSKRKELVALKITRRTAGARSQAKLETDILLKLNSNVKLRSHVVRLHKVFDWQGHLVLVFELLSFNLYELIECTRFEGVSLDLVRKFAYQLTLTLMQLELQRPYPVVHCDLKPENILLQTPNRCGIRLIDFGTSCYMNRRVHTYIQSRFYRSPEVILRLEYGTAIDRWSLGCVLVEMHTGVALFPSRDEASQLAKFEATLGPLPTDMVACSPKLARFYMGGTTPDGGYRLRDGGLPARPLETVIGVTTGGPGGRRAGTAGHTESTYREFLDFVSQLLRYRPEERISCQDALRHPFLAPLLSSDAAKKS